MPNLIKGQTLLKVTKEDAGKVLTVLEDGSVGLTGPFVVTFSGTNDSGDAACDKTFSEIADADGSGKKIIARYLNGIGSYDLNLLLFHSSVDGTLSQIMATYLSIADLSDIMGEYVNVYISFSPDSLAITFSEA